MSPSQTPRRATRALRARALAGVAVFCALAVALIAAAGADSLASAQSAQTAAPAAGPAPETGPAAAAAPQAAAAAPQTPPAPQPAPAAPAAPQAAAAAQQPPPAGPAAPQAASPAPKTAPAQSPPPVPEPAAHPSSVKSPAPAPPRQPEPAADEPVAIEESAEPSAERKSAGAAERLAARSGPPEGRASASQGDASGEERGSGGPSSENGQGGDEQSGSDQRGFGSDGAPNNERDWGEERGQGLGEEPGQGRANGHAQSWGNDRGLGGERGRGGGAEGEPGAGARVIPGGESPTGGERPGNERRIPNLTGARRIAEAGDRGAGRIGGGLSSLRPPAAVAPPEPPLDEAPSQEGAPTAEPSSPSPESPPAPSSEAGQSGRTLDEGSPASRVTKLALPVAASGGGTSTTGGGTGTTTIDGGAVTTGGGAGTTSAGGGALPAPAAGADFVDAVGRSEGGGNGSANPGDQIKRRGENEDQPLIIRPVERLVNKVPDSLKYALAALGVLSLLLGLGYLLTALRARSLARQRSDLLQEVGLLQSALLPPVPEKLGALRTSVAYRPADGPGAGGDFYDVLPLAAGRVGFILGDVSGHGRGALARTAFMRYTLRAYLEAGLEPRAALKVAGRVIDENLGGDFATVLLAVHDPETGSLTYATAGHPAPIVVGPQPHDPVTAGSSPPIGVGVPTGLRQTTAPLVPGSVACLFTDGLMEARAAGGILGRDRLEQMLLELGDDASARALIERVSQEARVLSDDIAAVVVSPTEAVKVSSLRTEQLELTARELDGPLAHRFLGACGVPKAAAASAVEEARTVASVVGGAVLDVACGERPSVEVLPRSVEGLETASRRTASG